MNADKLPQHVLQQRRWPHVIYIIAWICGVCSCLAAVYMWIQPVVLAAALRIVGIGLAVFGLAVVGVLTMSGLDRRWPKRRYRLVQVTADGLLFTRRMREGEAKDTLKWDEIEQVEIERRPFYREVRIIGAGGSRGKSLKLNSLCWSGLDKMVSEVLSRSQARLVEGRRDRPTSDYS